MKEGGVGGFDGRRRGCVKEGEGGMTRWKDSGHLDTV